MPHLTDMINSADRTGLAYLGRIAVALANGNDGTSELNDLAAYLLKRARSLGSYAPNDVPNTNQLMVADIAAS